MFRLTTRPGIPGTVLIPEVTDEEFIVWMRTAGMPTFKKLNRIVAEKEFPAGYQLELRVNNQFPVSGFNGEKAVVFSTMSILGGKNPFLGYAYITVGSACLILAVLFLAKHSHSPRTLGDMTYFQWNQGDRRIHVVDNGSASHCR
uniref:Uncharacterized protein n=1 Tax=Spongospora subterranea TaxID=70186 RepID=A0A0H5QSB8_9EUKA|eukprot:CRZ04466.1 hypothetical protein [Spongospora subterranea]